MRPYARNMPIASIGQSAPPFSLSGIDSRSYTLNQNGARLTLAVFFKTSCPTSALTFPYLAKFHQVYHAIGLAVWGISQDPRDLTSQFAADHQSTFPILLDTAWRVSRMYDPEFVPTLLLIDNTGHILDSAVGLDKAKLNHISQIVAARLGVPPALIALPDDGQPAFKPG